MLIRIAVSKKQPVLKDNRLLVSTKKMTNRLLSYKKIRKNVYYLRGKICQPLIS